MKKIFLITILIILNSILSELCSAQVKDSLIQLTPQIGDNISLSERNYYDLFPNIQGFEYATIYIRNDTVAVSRIIYQNENRKSEELIIRNNVVYIGNLRAYIRQIDNDNLAFQKRSEELKQIEKFGGISQLTTLVTVTTKDGYDYKGWLWSVKEDSIFIIPDTISTKSTLDIVNNYLTFTSEDIQSVFIESEDNVGSGFGTGALIGAGIGVLSGLLANAFFSEMGAEDNAVGAALLGGLTFGLGGGFIGMIIGSATSGEDETVQINSAADMELLKEYLVQ
jgi:hypothetical protein